MTKTIKDFLNEVRLEHQRAAFRLAKNGNKIHRDTLMRLSSRIGELESAVLKHLPNYLPPEGRRTGEMGISSLGRVREDGLSASINDLREIVRWRTPEGTTHRGYKKIVDAYAALRNAEKDVLDATKAIGMDADIIVTMASAYEVSCMVKAAILLKKKKRTAEQQLQYRSACSVINIVERGTVVLFGATMESEVHYLAGRIGSFLDSSRKKFGPANSSPVDWDFFPHEEGLEHHHPWRPYYPKGEPGRGTFTDLTTSLRHMVRTRISYDLSGILRTERTHDKLRLEGSGAGVTRTFAQDKDAPTGYAQTTQVHKHEPEGPSEGAPAPEPPKPKAPPAPMLLPDLERFQLYTPDGPHVSIPKHLHDINPENVRVLVVSKWGSWAHMRGGAAVCLSRVSAPELSWLTERVLRTRNELTSVPGTPPPEVVIFPI